MGNRIEWQPKLTFWRTVLKSFKQVQFDSKCNNDTVTLFSDGLFAQFTVANSLQSSVCAQFFMNFLTKLGFLEIPWIFSHLLTANTVLHKALCTINQLIP